MEIARKVPTELELEKYIQKFPTFFSISFMPLQAQLTQTHRSIANLGGCSRKFLIFLLLFLFLFSYAIYISLFLCLSIVKKYQLFNLNVTAHRSNLTSPIHNCIHHKDRF